MPDYRLEIKQLVSYPRCRIYREFLQTLIADRGIRTMNRIPSRGQRKNIKVYVASGRSYWSLFMPPWPGGAFL